MVFANDTIPARALNGSLRDYMFPSGLNLTERAEDFFVWQDLRRKNGLWPYARSTETAPKTHCSAKSDSGDRISGVNFASQDYLSLSSHPHVKSAAIRAVEAYGVHSAGSAALLGNTQHSLRLEARLSELLNGRAIALYPTGWSAGFASIQGFVHQDDHVVMDVLAHSCLQEGARASTSKTHYFGHLNLRGLERRLKRIRKTDPQNAILVVTESLFSMHSDTPDIAKMQEICSEWDANLLVDCAHDFGCIGADGLGHLGEQNSLDAPDIIIGSFSKSFASNGGFVAVKTTAAAEYLKYFSATQTFSNALSPAQSATVNAAIDIIESEEGRDRREKLMGNILHLRRQARRVGLQPLGDPSPIVPIAVGAEGVARIASQLLNTRGAIANLVEYPAVQRGTARFRVQVMADHSIADINFLVASMKEAMEEARDIHESIFDYQHDEVVEEPLCMAEKRQPARNTLQTQVSA